MERQKYLFLFFAFCTIYVTESSFELKSYTSCYGTFELENFLQPSCPAGQKIVVKAVYALAKYKSTGCPQEQFETIDPSCCQYDARDCSALYNSGSYQNYYKTCNGKSSCLIRVSRIDIPSHCNSSVYIERTHYMKMDYYCISDQAVDPCTDMTTSDSPTFFWNSGYPAEMTPTSTSCTCSIEMSCDTTVQLTAIDLQLKGDGNCKQSLTITDGNSSSTLNCSSNNEFIPDVIYTSSGHFLKILFVNNLGATGGKFLIQVKGSNPTGEVNLSCGASASTVSSLNSSSLPTCQKEGDKPTHLPTFGTTTKSEDSTTLTAMSTEDPTLFTSPTSDPSTVSPTTLPTVQTDDSTTHTNAMTTEDSATPTTVMTTEDSTTLSTAMITENSTMLTNAKTTEDSTTNTNAMTTEYSTKRTNSMTTEDSTARTNSISTEGSTTRTSAMTTVDSTTLTNAKTTEDSTKSTTAMETVDSTVTPTTLPNVQMDSTHSSLSTQDTDTQRALTGATLNISNECICTKEVVIGLIVALVLLFIILVVVVSICCLRTSA